MELNGTAKLVVTENDNGDSLYLPGEWECDNVDHNDAGESVTTYAFSGIYDRDDLTSLQARVEPVLDGADGVVSYKWLTA